MLDMLCFEHDLSWKNFRPATVGWRSRRDALNAILILCLSDIGIIVLLGGPARLALTSTCPRHRCSSPPACTPSGMTSCKRRPPAGRDVLEEYPGCASCNPPSTRPPGARGGPASPVWRGRVSANSRTAQRGSGRGSAVEWATGGCRAFCTLHGTGAPSGKIRCRR